SRAARPDAGVRRYLLRAGSRCRRSAESRAARGRYQALGGKVRATTQLTTRAAPARLSMAASSASVAPVVMTIDHDDRRAVERALAAKRAVHVARQRVGRKAVSERGDGRIVVRRVGGASPADRAFRARAARSAGATCRRAAADRRRKPGRECRAPRRGEESSCRRTADSKGIRACYRFGLWTVAQLSADLAAGTIISRGPVEQALPRLAAPEGEGARAFLKLYTDTARAEAEFSDRLRRAGIRRSPVDGLPISLKDLFDVAGDVTRAGSEIRAEAPPGKGDAPAVARLGAGG